MSIGILSTIKSKLMFGFFLISALLVVVGTVGFVNSLHIDTAFDTATNKTLPELLVIGNIQSSIKKMSSDIVGFALQSPEARILHQERLHQMMQDNKTMNSLVNQLGKSTDPSEKPSYDLIKSQTSAFSRASFKLINSKLNGMSDQSILILIRSVDDIRSQIDTVSSQILSMKEAALRNQIEKADDAIVTQQVELIIASIVAFTISLLIGRHISQFAIIKPLLNLKNAASKIASGDFDFDFEIKRFNPSDEIGELSIQFDTMKQILNQKTKQLETSNRQLLLANEHLKEHDKVQQDFINIAAHELRTPIQPLLMSSERLKELMPNDELVSTIFRNAKKLQDLSNAILDAARIESKTIKISKKTINLKDVIVDSLQEINTLTGSKCAIFYEPRDLYIEGDRDRLTRVIYNLLTNALKATDQGKILVSAQERNEDGQVIVSVKDTGHGINPEIKPRLFTKFATNSFDGTGLGLFISKGIIEAHGGKIWAENNTNGTKGTTFSFSIHKADSDRAKV